MADNKKRILIVEDERSIAQILAFNLLSAGYDCEHAADGEEGLKRALTGDFDLILLDVMMPKMDGFEVCRHIREKLTTPVIMVTAREDEIDRIYGLDIGADDYVTKPFRIKELLARINANIRRSSNELPSVKETDPDIITIRGLVIDSTSFTVTKDGEKIPLTKKEYELLRYLAQNEGKIVTREQILEKVWGYDSYLGDLQNVDVTVSRMRKKLEADTQNPEYLFTMRGIGYFVK